MVGYRTSSLFAAKPTASALLALVVSLILAACGGGTPATETPKPAPTVASTVAPTSTAAASTTAPTAAAKPSATPDDYPAGTPAATAAATRAPQGTAAAGSAVAASGTQQPAGTSANATLPPPDGIPLSKDDFWKFVALFSDKPLTGGQTPPRISKFANRDVFFFLQFDKSTGADSTQLRYIGIGQRGQFCSAKQPTTDFTHFHRYSSPTYAEGHGGPSDARGYWLQFNAVTEIESNTGKVTWGPDRKFSPTPPPPCP